MSIKSFLIRWNKNEKKLVLIENTTGQYIGHTSLVSLWMTITKKELV